MGVYSRQWPPPPTIQDITNSFLFLAHFLGTHRHTMGHEGVGIHEVTSWCRRSGWLSRELRCQLLHHLFQMFCCKWGYPIPGLRLTPGQRKGTRRVGTQRAHPECFLGCPGPHSPVEVVNGVTPVITQYANKGWEDHAHIQPGHLHARDICIDVAQYRLFQHWHHIQVPTTRSILLIGQVFVEKRWEFC